MSHVPWSVCVSVCHNEHSTPVNPAKTAKPVEMPFALWTHVGPRNHVLDGSWGARWRHLTNTIKLSVLGGDAALCRISLTARHQLLLFTVDCVWQMGNWQFDWSSSEILGKYCVSIVDLFKIKTYFCHFIRIFNVNLLNVVMSSLTMLFKVWH